MGVVLPFRRIGTQVVCAVILSVQHNGLVCIADFFGYTGLFPPGSRLLLAGGSGIPVIAGNRMCCLLSGDSLWVGRVCLGCLGNMFWTRHIRVVVPISWICHSSLSFCSEVAVSLCYPSIIACLRGKSIMRRCKKEHPVWMLPVCYAFDTPPGSCPAIIIAQYRRILQASLTSMVPLESISARCRCCQSR